LSYVFRLETYSTHDISLVTGTVDLFCKDLIMKCEWPYSDHDNGACSLVRQIHHWTVSTFSRQFI